MTVIIKKTDGEVLQFKGENLRLSYDDGGVHVFVWEDADYGDAPRCRVLHVCAPGTWVEAGYYST